MNEYLNCLALTIARLGTVSYILCFQLLYPQHPSCQPFRISWSSLRSETRHKHSAQSEIVSRMGKQASRRVTSRRTTYSPYCRTNVINHSSQALNYDDVECSSELEDGEIIEKPAIDSCLSLGLEDGEITEEWSTDSSASSDHCWSRDSHTHSSLLDSRILQIQTLLAEAIRNASYSSLDRYTPFETRLPQDPTESPFDYYIRTAFQKYKLHIARHSGIISSEQHVLEYTCAATRPNQKTCVHLGTIPGDIVKYIPMGTSDDVLGDCAGGARLTTHFVVLLPFYFKRVTRQADKDYHAALVISKNPVGPNKLLCPQKGDENYRATNVPILQTVVFDAHCDRRSLVVDDAFERQWEWKENTSITYQVKTVHQQSLHAVICSNQPTYGLRLSDGAFQQVLSDLAKENERKNWVK